MKFITAGPKYAKQKAKKQFFSPSFIPCFLYRKVHQFSPFLLLTVALTLWQQLPHPKKRNTLFASNNSGLLTHDITIK